jgi:prepilin-type processing-associated H-X9-DG protein
MSNTFWTEKAWKPYGLYKLDTKFGTTVPGTSYSGATVLRCPESKQSFIDERNGRLGTTYALNQYLGGQEAFGNDASGNLRHCPLPKLNRLHGDTYWFCDAGTRISGLNQFDFYFGVMQLGTTGAPNAASTLTSWPWCWDYRDCPKLPQLYGHPNYVANFVFGDGHVAAVTRKEFQAMSSATNGRFLGRFY